jgi:hypothetical protein
MLQLRLVFNGVPAHVHLLHMHHPLHLESCVLCVLHSIPSRDSANTGACLTPEACPWHQPLAGLGSMLNGW